LCAELQALTLLEMKRLFQLGSRAMN